jgi:hypothetical protein
MSDASYPQPVQQPACLDFRARFLLASQTDDAGAPCARVEPSFHHPERSGLTAMRRGLKEPTVYRVLPGPVNTWGVYTGPSREAVASFPDKSTAVRYAMRLARGELTWSPPPAAAAAAAAAAGASAQTPQR